MFEAELAFFCSLLRKTLFCLEGGLCLIILKVTIVGWYFIELTMDCGLLTRVYSLAWIHHHSQDTEFVTVKACVTNEVTLCQVVEDLTFNL